MAAETDANTFMQKYPGQEPAWMKAAPASHFSATIEGIHSTQVQTWTRMLTDDNFGYQYLNPVSQDYGNVPSVYADEVNAINAINKTKNA